jgi:phosphoglucosamine mutase
VIFLDHNTTGDGILSAIQLAGTVKSTGKSLSELKSMMRKFPQVLLNVRVVDKSKLKDNIALQASIDRVEAALGDNGRVLVRPSGTESLIRVMVEGPDKAEIERYAEDIADVVRAQLV